MPFLLRAKNLESVIYYSQTFVWRLPRRVAAWYANLRDCTLPSERSVRLGPAGTSVWRVARPSSTRSLQAAREPPGPAPTNMSSPMKHSAQLMETLNLGVCEAFRKCRSRAHGPEAPPHLRSISPIPATMRQTQQGWASPAGLEPLTRMAALETNPGSGFASQRS